MVVLGMAITMHADPAPALDRVPALIPLPAEVAPLTGELQLSSTTPLVIVAERAESAEVAKTLAGWLAAYPGLTVRHASVRPASAIHVHLRLDANEGPDDPEGYRLRVRSEGVEIPRAISVACAMGPSAYGSSSRATRRLQEFHCPPSTSSMFRAFAGAG